MSNISDVVQNDLNKNGKDILNNNEQEIASVVNYISNEEKHQDTLALMIDFYSLCHKLEERDINFYTIAFYIKENYGMEVLNSFMYLITILIHDKNVFNTIYDSGVLWDVFSNWDDTSINNIKAYAICTNEYLVKGFGKGISDSLYIKEDKDLDDLLIHRKALDTIQDNVNSLIGKCEVKRTLEDLLKTNEELKSDDDKKIDSIVNKIWEGQAPTIDSIIADMLSIVSENLESCFVLDVPESTVMYEHSVRNNGTPCSKSNYIYPITDDKNNVTGFKLAGQSKNENVRNIVSKVVNKAYIQNTQKGFGWIPKRIDNDNAVDFTIEDVLNSSYDYSPCTMLLYALGYVNFGGVRYKTFGDFKVAYKEDMMKKAKEILRYFVKCDLDKADGNETNLEESKTFNEFLVILGGRFKIAYTTGIVILRNDSAVINIRISSSALDCNESNRESLKSSIVRESNFQNSTIYVEQGGSGKLRNLETVLIILDMARFDSVPRMGYEVVEALQRNNKISNFNSGVPIGVQKNGKLVDLRFTQQNFSMVIAAASRQGKGVLTLSILASALGSGIPVCYTDSKPEMAEMFWKLQKKYLDGNNRRLYSYDNSCPLLEEVNGAKQRESSRFSNSNSYTVGTDNELYGDFDYLPIVYARSVQLMCLCAQIIKGFKDQVGDITPPIFVFDEVNKGLGLIEGNLKKETSSVLKGASSDLISSIKSKIDKLKEVVKSCKKEDVELKNNSQKSINALTNVLEWYSSVISDVRGYYDTYGGVSGVRTILIGQGELKLAVSNVKPGLMSTLRYHSNTAIKVMGSWDSLKYGTNLDEDSLPDRWWVKYTGECRDGESGEIFKPYLTMVDDNPYSEPWIGTANDRKGLGVYNFDYDDSNKERYINKLQSVYGSEDKDTLNEYGISKGTGFEGLTEMYCKLNNTNMVDALASGYETVVKLASIVKLIGEGCLFETIEEFLYNGKYWFTNAQILAGAAADALEKDDDSSTDTNLNNGNTNIQSENPFNIEDIGEQEPIGIENFENSKLDNETPVNNETSETKNIVGIENFDNIAPNNSSTPTINVKEDNVRTSQEAINNGNANKINLDDIDTLDWNTFKNKLEGFPEFSNIENSNLTYGEVVNPGYEPLTTEEQAKFKPDIMNKHIGNNEIMDMNGRVWRAYVDKNPIELPLSQVKELVGKLNDSNGKYDMIPIETVKFLSLTESNSIDVNREDVEASVIEKIAGKFLSKSIGGKNRIYDLKWRNLLRGAVTKVNRGLVSNISITEHVLVINGRLVRTEGILHDKNIGYISIADIISFKTLHSEYPNIRQLSVDKPIYDSALYEFGENITKSLFDLFERLDKLVLKSMSEGQADVLITRRDIIDNTPKTEEIKDLEKERRTAQKIKFMSATMSHEEVPDNVVTKIYREQSSSAKEDRELFRKLMREDKVKVGQSIRIGAMATIGTLVSIPFGVVGWSFKQMGKGIKHLFKMTSDR